MMKLIGLYTLNHILKKCIHEPYKYDFIKLSLTSLAKKPHKNQSFLKSNQFNKRSIIVSYSTINDQLPNLKY